MDQRPVRVRGEHGTVLFSIKGSLYNGDLVTTVVRMWNSVMNG